jgi:hypothetical protein
MAMTQNDVLHAIMAALEESGRVQSECSHGTDVLDENGAAEPDDRNDYAVFVLTDKHSGTKVLCSLYARDIGVQ